MNTFNEDLHGLHVFFDEPGGGDGGGDGGDGGGDGGTGGDGGGDAGAGGKGEGDKLPDGAFMLADWRGTLPKDLAEHASLAKIEKLEDMARSYVNGQQLTGMDPSRTFVVPDNSDGEGRRAVLTKLGLPAEAKGYTMEAVKDSPEWLGLDQPLSVAFVTRAHKLGVLPEHVQGLYSGFVTDLIETQKTQDAAEEAKASEGIRALQAEWGGAFDQRAAAANFAIDKLGGDPLRKWIDDNNGGSDPVVMKAFAEVGLMLAEDKTKRGDGPALKFGETMTPEEARSRGNALLEEALNLPMNDSRKKRLNEQAQEFFKMASPGNVPTTL